MADYSDKTGTLILAVIWLSAIAAALAAAFSASGKWMVALFGVATLLMIIAFLYMLRLGMRGSNKK